MGTFDVADAASFDACVASMRTVQSRPEILLEQLPAPSSLAPYSYAVGATVTAISGDEIGSGRLVLLCDPDGMQAWDGQLRIVVFATFEIEQEIAIDPLLAEVAWSWLTDALVGCDVGYTALGGTVTSTSSTRFGDISGPQRADDVELRASWTPTEIELDGHLSAFLELLETAAGLPPEGVVSLSAKRPLVVRA